MRHDFSRRIMNQEVSTEWQQQHSKAGSDDCCLRGSKAQTVVDRPHKPIQQTTSKHANVHGKEWEERHDIEGEHYTAADQIEGVASSECSRRQRTRVTTADAQANKEIDCRSDGAHRQNKAILGQPCAE